MPFFFMLAMQAAGMITDYFGTKNQDELMGLGVKLKNAELDTNLEENRLETENASLEGLKQLRQTLGSQIAVMAARGTSTAGGSAASLLNESQANFNSNDQILRLNSMGRENQLRAGAAVSRLQNSSNVSKLWQGFASRTLNRFPSSVSGWKQAGSDFTDSISDFKMGG
jgi:hypothetical protein